MDSNIEKQLADYLGIELNERANGYTREAMIKAVQTVSEGLQKHEQTCNRRWEQNEEVLRSFNKRITSIEGKPNMTRKSIIPEAPEPVTAAHNIIQLTERVKDATVKGLKEGDPGKYVESIVEEVMIDREGKRALNAETNRRRSVGLIIVGAAGGAGALMLYDLFKWATSLHH